jgi:hypothetical protein
LNPNLKEILADLYKRKYLYGNPKFSHFVENPYLNDIKAYSAPMSPRGVVSNLNPSQDTMLLKEGSPSPRYDQMHELSHILENRQHPAGEKTPVHPFLQSVNPFDNYRFKRALGKTLENKFNSLRKKYPALNDDPYLGKGFDNLMETGMHEILASLNALEDTYEVDLLRDKDLKEAFFNEKIKNAYKASSGFNRTRMDAKDASPFTLGEYPTRYGYK